MADQTLLAQVLYSMKNLLERTLADDGYAPQDETEETIEWYARAREAALASEVEKFRMTAGDATLRLVELWQARAGGTARVLDLLETTPADVFTEEADSKLQVLREMLSSPRDTANTAGKHEAHAP